MISRKRRPLGIGLHQHVAEHRVAHERGIGDDLVRAVLGGDAFADRHHHVLEHVDIHALVRRIDRRHAGGVREQVQDGDIVAALTCELGHHVFDLGVKGELAHFDRAQHQHIGERLGDREQAEDRILLHRDRLLRIRVPERFVEPDLAMARDDHRAAEIKVFRDIVFDDGFEVLQPLGIQSVMGVHAFLAAVWNGRPGPETGVKSKSRYARLSSSRICPFRCAYSASGAALQFLAMKSSWLGMFSTVRLMPERTFASSVRIAPSSWPVASGGKVSGISP